METFFQWAMLTADRKQYVLNVLAEKIQEQTNHAIMERLKASFDRDSFNRMTDKDIFKIDMQMRVPVSLIQHILKELDDEVTKISEGVEQSVADHQSSGQTEEAQDKDRPEGSLPAPEKLGSDSDKVNE